MTLAVLRAYLSYQSAERKMGKALQDRKAYDLLNEEGIPEDAGDSGALTDYELPKFDTWARQVRKARQLLRNQKHTRRAGRPTGKSVVRQDQIERPERDD
jgi:hypothetical protein